MKRLSFLLILMVLSSCNYLEKKKINSEDLLNEELQTFNWNDVDTYPTFKECQSITEKEESKVCFQNTLLTNVNTYLKSQNIIVSQDVSDTISIKILIDKNGLLQVQEISVKPETVAQIPDIDSLLRQSLMEMPKIYPAIKRNQQVSIQFQLPVIVEIH